MLLYLSLTIVLFGAGVHGLLSICSTLECAPLCIVSSGFNHLTLAALDSLQWPQSYPKRPGLASKSDSILIDVFCLPSVGNQVTT